MDDGRQEESGHAAAAQRGSATPRGKARTAQAALPQAPGAPEPRTVAAGPAIAAAAALRDATRGLATGTAWTYRPLDYAWNVHAAYLARYAGPKAILLLGMNPGPWGMGQTGVPFGDAPTVRGWLGLSGRVVAPADVHPKRPVQGLACRRTEASGQRLWGFLRARFHSAERALRDLLVVNYCPLLLFNGAGQNVTPDKLPAAPRRALHDACDAGLRRMVQATGAQRVVGVGAYAAARAREALDPETAVSSMPHPSPASPLANRDGGAPWRAAVEHALLEAGLDLPAGT